MSDNYPPGVSGNEWQIAGGVARSRYVTCPEWECDFEGYVDTDEYDDTVMWTCPNCDAEHEDDRFFEGWGE